MGSIVKGGVAGVVGALALGFAGWAACRAFCARPGEDPALSRRRRLRNAGFVATLLPGSPGRVARVAMGVARARRALKGT